MLDYFNNMSPLIIIFVIQLYFLIIIFFIGLFILFWAVQFHLVIALLVLDYILLINIGLLSIHSVWTITGSGYSYAIIVIAVAACDTVIGLGLFIAIYRDSRQYYL